MAVKAMAKWSLASNASSHPRVLETCVKENAGKGLSARLSLLEIEAESHLSNWDFEKAEESLVQYLELNPDNPTMVRKHQDALAGIISFPPMDRGKRSVLARPEVYVVLGLGWILIQFGDQWLEGFRGMLDWSPSGIVISGVVCFLLATALGVYRQTSNRLLESAYPIETTEGPVYLGTVPAQTWFSPVVRGGSWLVVGILSVWPAGVFAALLGVEAMEFAVWFALTLAARWLLSKLGCRLLLGKYEQRV